MHNRSHKLCSFIVKLMLVQSDKVKKVSIYVSFDCKESFDCSINCMSIDSIQCYNTLS